MVQDNEEAKRLAAQKRLEQLGAEAGSGISLKFKLILLLIFAVPIAIFKVPALETRILGAKLKYKLEDRKEYSTQGMLLGGLYLKEKFSSDKVLLDEFKLSLNSKLVSSDRDSGGNSNFNLNYNFVNLNYGPSLTNLDTLSDEKRIGFGRSWKMSQYGNRISTFDQAADSIRATAKAQKHQHELRARLAEESGGYPGFGSEDEEPPPPSKPTDFLKKDYLNIISNRTMFTYQKDRIKPGHQWEQKVRWNFFSSHFDIRPYQNSLVFSVKEFVKSDGKILIIIDYSGIPQGDLTWKSPGFSELSRSFLIQGEIKGTIQIDYDTGLVQNLDGQFDFTIEPDAIDTNVLFDLFPVLSATSVDIGNSIFTLEGKHTIEPL